MKVFDFSFINKGGGLVLMLEFISSLDDFTDIVFVVDHRFDRFEVFKGYPLVLVSNGFLHREILLFKIRFLYDVKKIFYFNNVASLSSFNVHTLVYFHNVSYFKSDFSRLKRFYFRFCGIFVNYWFVQTSLVRSKIFKIFPNSNVLVAPFFPSFHESFSSPNLTLSPGKIFIFPSLLTSYKGVDFLFTSFEVHLNFFPDSKLIVFSDNNVLDCFVSPKLRKSVINYGLVSHKQVLDYIISSDVVLFTSLYESFGLGLVEAASLGKPLIAPNLPYVHEVVYTDYLYNISDSFHDVVSGFSCLLNKVDQFSTPASLLISDRRQCLFDYLDI